MIRRTQLGERLKGRNRNKPCRCGGGKKYKACHLEEDLKKIIKVTEREIKGLEKKLKNERGVYAK